MTVGKLHLLACASSAMRVLYPLTIIFLVAGEMMMSLLWYYRPEHTEQGRQRTDGPDEVFASRHKDHNSVACIEDKCYVLTFSEYCRY